LNVGFVLSVSDAASSTAAKGKDSKGTDKGSEASEISSVIQVGHVVLVQDARPPRAGSKAGSQNASPMRATANRSDYDGRSQLLHLSGSPRIVDGGLDLTAELIDFARASGDAFAHGNVKASWIGDGQSPIPGSGLLAGGAENRQSAGKAGAKSNDSPMHAVAPEAEVHQATGDVIFRGQAAGNQPRLWQGASSISAPTITLNQPRQTLVAVANGAANPVRTVLVNAPSADRNASAKVAKGAGKGKSDSPSVIRMRSGELRYSEGERTALLFAGSVGNVTAETSGASGSATIVSQQAEVKLLPVGVHGVSRTGGSAGASAGSTSVDRLTARGHVTVDWPERKGTGEKLVYLGEDGTFTLTGTSSAPPRITDQARGTVTGNSLIFHSHDDSVTVEGDGSKTSTETQSPR
jgi:lipopolysaccharide export system protein LptA